MNKTNSIEIPLHGFSCALAPDLKGVFHDKAKYDIKKILRQNGLADKAALQWEKDELLLFHLFEGYRRHPVPEMRKHFGDVLHSKKYQTAAERVSEYKLARHDKADGHEIIRLPSAAFDEMLSTLPREVWCPYLRDSDYYKSYYKNPRLSNDYMLRIPDDKYSDLLKEQIRDLREFVHSKCFE